MFHISGNMWDGSPAHATIYHEEEFAQRQIDDMRHHKRAGFGADCVVEVVPLDGALRTTGIEINIEDIR